MPPTGLPSDSNLPGGRVEIADSAIVSLIRDATLSCYGVVELGPRSWGTAIAQRFGLGRGTGVAIEHNDGALVIEVSIVVEYGTPIFTVAQNVMQAITFQVREVLGLRVDRVNVNVDGLHMSTTTGSTI